MKEVEELEMEEIAEILSMTENAVTVNLSRARKKMREMIIATQLKERKHYERY
jgi:RNA polymerase sigma-70 factor (ECF subfamily)